MEMLRTRGIGGVRVLPLSKQLHVSRGSFYWHFENLQDLQDAMLDWWERAMTDSVIERIEAAPRGGRKRLMLAGENILGADLSRYDSSIRSWADGDKKAARVLRRVLRKRLDYITSLFAEAGFSPAEARARGELMAVYLMSERAILMDESLKDRLRLLRRQIRSLMS